jgi:hypothetical protein
MCLRCEPGAGFFLVTKLTAPTTATLSYQYGAELGHQPLRGRNPRAPSAHRVQSKEGSYKNTSHAVPPSERAKPGSLAQNQDLWHRTLSVFRAVIIGLLVGMIAANILIAMKRLRTLGSTTASP